LSVDPEAPAPAPAWAARFSQAAAWGGPAAALALAHDSPQDLPARGRLWATAIARAAGFSLVERHGDGVIVQRGGDRVLLLPVVVSAPVDPGPAQAIASLLQPIFADRSWALILRRSIDAACDVGRIAEPTRQWIARYDQKKWDADYAIYEDVDMSVEFRMLPFAGAAGSGPAIRVVQPPGDHLLDRAETQVQAALQAIPVDLPTVVIPLRDARWGVGRRTRIDRLYGKLIEARATSGLQSSFSVRRSPTAWFGREGWHRVAAVWWLWPDPTDPLAPRGHADENPWCSAAAPTFVGERLAVTAVGSADDPAPPASLTRVRPAFGVRP